MGRRMPQAMRVCYRGSMWTEPYLEPCCRSALHRLVLAGPLGRPTGLKDGPCLDRLTGMGLAERKWDGRVEITEAGLGAHRRFVRG